MISRLSVIEHELPSSLLFETANTIIWAVLQQLSHVFHYEVEYPPSILDEASCVSALPFFRVMAIFEDSGRKPNCPGYDSARN